MQFLWIYCYLGVCVVVVSGRVERRARDNPVVLQRDWSRWGLWLQDERSGMSLDISF